MVAVTLNYMSILVASIVSTALGYVWYSRYMFGEKFLQYLEISDEEMDKIQPNMRRIYLISFISSLILALALAVLVGYFHATTLIKGAEIGLLAWVGFVITTNLNSVLFERRPKELYLISIGYRLVELVLMAIILSLWQ